MIVQKRFILKFLIELKIWFKKIKKFTGLLIACLRPEYSIVSKLNPYSDIPSLHLLVQSQQ